MRSRFIFALTTGLCAATLIGGAFAQQAPAPAAPQTPPAAETQTRQSQPQGYGMRHGHDMGHEHGIGHRYGMRHRYDMGHGYGMVRNYSYGGTSMSDEDRAAFFSAQDRKSVV